MSLLAKAERGERWAECWLYAAAVVVVDHLLLPTTARRTLRSEGRYSSVTGSLPFASVVKEQQTSNHAFSLRRPGSKFSDPCPE